MRDFIYSILATLLIMILVGPVIATGQVRGSSNFQMERDSLNIGGGFGVSDNFSLQDTIGDVAIGYSASDSYRVIAGFQQSLEEEFISISSPVDLNMGSINGVVGGVATSSASWTVTTNNNAGYSLNIKSGTSPALASSLDYFEDYTTETSDPDLDFSIDSTTAEFGFNPYGVDVTNKFKNNGTTCNTGSSVTSLKCWVGLSTTGENIVQRTSANDPSGTVTTINFRAEQGQNKIITAGSYSATITITAIAL